jgi:hypothetical protein
LVGQAIILYEGTRGPRELRLHRILEFFGVPCKSVEISHLTEGKNSSLGYAVFGSIRIVAAALKLLQSTEDNSNIHGDVFYSYSDGELDACSRTLQSLLGDSGLSLQEAPPGNFVVGISDEVAEIAGPMAGLKVSTRLACEDAVLIGTSIAGEPYSTVISAGEASVFVRFLSKNVTIYFSTSSQIVDIDQPLTQGYYDVKEHFCSIVPLVMFIRYMFPDFAWRAQELGACLIIDDPLLKPRYGFCDFTKLRDLMRQYGFTTNIAFIPWNWRRTSLASSDFFRNESKHYSVSIHGCDHTAGEFGEVSHESLHRTARLAQLRMGNHEKRTGIPYDPVMVFPQGVFSSVCPEVLKKDGFLAAVNTEVVPVDSQNAHTRIRDVWDVAITTYGGFPIFTRRYASHGLENFAFDLLLGKPCLIVAHHDFFKDGGASLIELVQKIGSWNCCIVWRPLGEVIRRACRRRGAGTGVEEVEMYGSVLQIDNPSDREIQVRIRKMKCHDDVVSEVLCDEKPITWGTEEEHIVFRERIMPLSEKRFKVIYREPTETKVVGRSLRFELTVAVRRILSEVRDDYIDRSRFLSIPANKLRGSFRRASQRG